MAAAASDNLVLRRPDDLHLHVRDGDYLTTLGRDMPPIVKRAIIMPNLVPPVTTTEEALAYRNRVLAALPADSTLQPLMTLYLTDKTPPEEVRKAYATGKVFAVKLYPAGATTNSDSGVTDIALCRETLNAMAEIGMPLLVHGEVTDTSVDIFDREAVFIERHMKDLVASHPDLKIVMEHITTKQAVDFVSSQGSNVAATITCHHLLFTRSAIFDKGLRPHMYCLPVLKTEVDRKALIGAVQSGSSKFFMGSDSAPHPRQRKEASCCSAGCFTAHALMEMYATAFEQGGCLENLQAFSSEHGAAFYGLPRNEETITLAREDWTVPETLPLGTDDLVPMMAGETLHFKAYLGTVPSAAGEQPKRPKRE